MGDQVGQFAERHVHVREHVRLGLNDELLFVAAALVDFGDARHGAQKWLDDVFLDFAQFDQLLQFGGGFVCRVGAILDVVIKNFAQARADRSEFCRRARRQFFQNALQTLRHKLAGAKNVRAISEVQSNLRKAKLRQRTHLFHSRQAGHFDFNRPSHELFRFLGGQSGDLGVDLHLHTGDVRHSVNRQMYRRPKAEAEQRDRAKQHDGALPDGKFKNLVNHGVKGSEICPASPFGPL